MGQRRGWFFSWTCSMLRALGLSICGAAYDGKFTPVSRLYMLVAICFLRSSYALELRLVLWAVTHRLAAFAAQSLLPYWQICSSAGFVGHVLWQCSAASPNLFKSCPSRNTPQLTQAHLLLLDIINGCMGSWPQGSQACLRELELLKEPIAVQSVHTVHFLQSVLASRSE